MLWWTGLNLGLWSRAVWKSTSENLVSLHAIEQTQLRRKYRVDGVGRPKFDFHTGVRGQLHALRGRLRRAAHLFLG